MKLLVVTLILLVALALLSTVVLTRKNSDTIRIEGQIFIPMRER
jgi:hypothetical protein